MSDENQAALEPQDKFVIDGGDQTSEQVEPEAQTTESAPVEDTNEQVAESKEDEPKNNKVQERINTITADKHKERRQREAETKRADDLQRQLDEYKANKPTLTKPTLEEHEYDEDAFNKADVAFQVQEQVAAEIATQKAQQETLTREAKMQESLDTFNERATALGKDDFAAKRDAIPELPAGVADAIMSLENGAEMVYHLGSHLDKADALASMTPMAAMMELGKISASMSTKPEIEISAAPDPIETLSSSGTLTKERGPVGATYT